MDEPVIADPPASIEAPHRIWPKVVVGAVIVLLLVGVLVTNGKASTARKDADAATKRADRTASELTDYKVAHSACQRLVDIKDEVIRTVPPVMEAVRDVAQNPTIFELNRASAALEEATTAVGEANIDQQRWVKTCFPNR